MKSIQTLLGWCVERYHVKDVPLFHETFVSNNLINSPHELHTPYGCRWVVVLIGRRSVMNGLKPDTPLAQFAAYVVCVQ